MSIKEFLKFGYAPFIPWLFIFCITIFVCRVTGFNAGLGGGISQLLFLYLKRKEVI